MIRFENVGMRYGMGPEILRDISFDLHAGSFHFLTGPSGAGKTTLLKLLYLAHSPSRGLIHFHGKNVVTAHRSELPALRRRIGIVFQDFQLIDHMTSIENVSLPLKLAGGNVKQVEDHAAELLEWVGLKDKMNARPSTLSGGEKQRVAIARAVINRPDLLLADEPTGNVDPQMAERIMNLFLELNKIGTTTIIATHDQQLVKTMNADRFHLEEGKLALLKAKGALKAPALQKANPVPQGGAT